MKNIIRAISNHKITLILWLFIAAYIGYFSFFSILRYRTLYASYYDLGIMNQTVYNTYQAIKTHDWSRVLEMTDPDSSIQIKRMAIHNDILMAAFAPFYFIHAGTETLLVIQTIILGIGAWAVFKIAQFIFQKNKYKELLSLIFALAYLLYSPMQRANIFDFHAVTLATTLLLFMFYFFLVKRYRWSFLFFILSILSKEEVALTTAFFSLYVLFFNKNNKSSRIYSLAMLVISIVWFKLSMSVIIPFFRGGHHFALSYYSDFGDSSTGIITGIIGNPFSLAKYLFRWDTLTYFFYLLGPLGFLSLLSPIHLLIATPEFAINLLSSDWNMRNVIYHYTSVIQPFVFISAIYGANKLMSLRGGKKIAATIIVFTLIFSYFKSPLPYSREAEIHPFKYPQAPYKEVAFWAGILKDDSLKIAATGQVAPHFSSRRYLYLFSDRYRLADYIVIRLTEIYNYPEKNTLIPVYNHLVHDKNFQLIFQDKGLQVFKKI